MHTSLILKLGIPIHEIGHALGLWHEQQRFDRDNYVRIESDNVYPRNLINFQKRSRNFMNTYDLPYDFNSVMHYSSKVQLKINSSNIDKYIN